MDDALLAQVRQAAGKNLSEWITRACLSRLLSQGMRSAREWERAHPAEAAAARAEDARHVLEAEAEREVEHQAQHQARIRGDDAEPSTEDYLAAYSHVRELLERAEQQLRDQHRRHEDDEQ